MKIDTRKVGNVTVISPEGKMVIGEPVETFEATVVDLVDRGDHLVVIDLSRVTRIDSSGVGSLVSALRNCRDEGGDVRLSGPSDHLRKVLEMMGLEQVFEIDPDTSSSISALEITST